MKFFRILKSTLLALFVILGSFAVFLFASAETQDPNSRAHIESIIYSNTFTLELNADEQEWLKQNPIIRLGVDRAFPPFGSITTDHEYIGFSADVMKVLEYRLGLKFKISKDAPWNETMEMAKSGKIDMISALVNSKERQQFLEFTSSYINNPTIIINDSEVHGYIGSLKNLNGKKVAIEAGAYSADVLAKEYPKIQLIPVENTSAALSLVSIGQADAYVGNGVTASYLIRKLGYHNLSYSGQTEYSSSHSVGIIKSNKKLASIMKKAVSSLSKNDTETIANYWFGMNAKPFISKRMAISIGTILGALIIFFGIWAFSLRKTKNELKKSQHLIKSQSEIDHLTGLGNRRKFYETLNSKINLSLQSQAPFALFFLDLDMFKEINDSFGHAIGDMLLIEASRRILMSVGELGLVSRIGGDEFMILIPNISNKDEINEHAECIRQSLGNAFDINGNVINVTASMGITRFPNDATNAEQLIINGDQAMYSAKKMGRDCYSYFNKVMREEAQYKAQLTRDLRVATSGNQFSLHYQPIVDLATNTINKAEALIRWNHPERGLVSPCEFISLAEEAGMINDIGEWTFKKAVNQTAKIQKRLNIDFQMTLNTSPLQYRKNGMNVSAWVNYMQACGLSGENLIVEITEGVLMEAGDSAIETLLQIRDHNVEVAIDDFGTGYSSLSYLKRFDIDYLKIDRSFVMNLTEGSDDVVLIQAIIVMAHQLGIKVVAEGIETAEQRDILVAAGCDFGQGYYFSRPVEEVAFMNLLESWGKKNKQSVESKIKVDI